MGLRKVVAVAVTALAACVVGACGSSSSSNSGGGASTGSGGTSKAHKSVGLLELVGAAEVTSRGANAIQTAGKDLNWSVTIVDPQGDPQKAVTGLQNLVTQGANGILVAPWESTVLRQALTAAQQASIPVGVVWGEVGAKTGYAGYYATPDETFGTKSVAVMKQVDPSGGNVAMFTSGAFFFGSTRDKKFTAGIAGDPKFKVVATHATDYTNAQADTTKAMNDILSANPNLNAVWADSSNQIPPIATVLKQKGLCGKVKVVGFYDDLANLQAVRDGCVTAILTASIEAQSWTAVDLMAGKLLANKPLPATVPTTYPFDTTTITVVTKTQNLPADPNVHVPFASDYVKYFTDKWAKGQYGAP
jgi:ABC-type sugar transport system substrate-binding protein